MDNICQTIESNKNDRVKLVKALTSQAKERRERRLTVADGAKLCHDAIAGGIILEFAFFTQMAAQKHHDLFAAAKKQTQVFIITEEISTYISDVKTPQGVFCVLALDKIQKQYTIYGDSLIVMLDGVQDPGNVGGIIRTAEALGANRVILSSACAEYASPKVIRASMGSSLRLPVHTADLITKLDELKTQGFHTYAAMLDTKAQPLNDVDFSGKCAVIIGSEGSGISEGVAAACEHSLYIPIQSAQSLNAAVAAGIIIYEMAKQLK
jgi:TrmH family RNA methyltransferase